MNKQTILVLVVILVINGHQTLGALTEVDIEVDPVISHYYEENEQNVYDTLLISLPNATLSPGDVFRVNISFTGGQLLEVIDAPYLAISPFFSTVGGWNTFGHTNDGTIALEITSYYNVLNTSRSAQPFCLGLYSTDDYYFIENFFFYRSAGEIVDGSLFGDFTAEFTVPMMVDGAPFSTKTYNGNSIRIEALLDNTFDHNILVLVPEPATIFLFAITGLLIRKQGL